MEGVALPSKKVGPRAASSPPSLLQSCQKHAEQQPLLILNHENIFEIFIFGNCKCRPKLSILSFFCTSRTVERKYARTEGTNKGTGN